MNLKKRPCEIIQSQKATYYMIPLYEMSRIGQSTEIENRVAVCEDLKGREYGEWLLVDLALLSDAIEIF